MPVPSPHKGESEREFISRCIRTMEHRDPDRSHEQIIAMCYSKLRATRGKKAGKRKKNK